LECFDPPDDRDTACRVAPKERTERAKECVMEFAIIFILLVVLDVAALRWGYDSTEGLHSPEWLRRQYRRAFL